jgi:hypothetical protein
MENQEHTSRIESGKQWMQCQMERIKPAVRNAGTKIQDQLRSRPAMWAGVAAGIGFAAGFAGRIARRRRRRLNDLDAFVIMEAC